ncbi:hypothetical protein BRC62_03260 [Halobacteriales archaeon QH_10_67_13]|nr:MAG: hypothetical protein BRC62_03260 [Halobacteriales archaeon QH_10_67_13]
MPDRSLSRRRALQIGAASLVPSLAGCLGDDRGRPWYAAWLPAGDGLAIAAVDLTRSADSEDGLSLLPAAVPGDDDPPTPVRKFELDISGLEGVTDPLVTFPLEVGARRVGFSTLGLGVTDLFPVIDRPEEFASELRRLLVLNSTIVAAGTVDQAEIDRRLTGVPAPFAAAYERTGSVAGSYDRYEPTETPDGLDQVPTVAVGSEAVVVSFDGDRLQRVIETKTGDRQSANGDRLAWLLKRVGAGDIVAGTIGSPPTNWTRPGARPSSRNSVPPRARVRSIPLGTGSRRPGPTTRRPSTYASPNGPTRNGSLGQKPKNLSRRARSRRGTCRRSGRGTARSGSKSPRTPTRLRSDWRPTPAGETRSAPARGPSRLGSASRRRSIRPATR